MIRRPPRSTLFPYTYALRNQLLRNLGNGEFADVTGTAGDGMQVVKSSRGAAFGDFDNDGQIDVVVINIDNTLTLLHNTTRNRNHWLTLRTIGSRSNRDGIGARLRLRVDGRVEVREVKTCGSFSFASDPRAHFLPCATRHPERTEENYPRGH